MKKKNIVVSVILSIVTFGIYGIIWFVQINNDVNTLANPEKKTSGGAAILLSIITCGIYMLFWANKTGGLLDEALKQRNMPAQNHGVLYLILHIFGLGLVAWILMQNAINSMIPDSAA